VTGVQGDAPSAREARHHVHEAGCDAATRRWHPPYALGDTVVYPCHGAGRIVGKELALLFGERREYLTIQILHSGMTIRLPTEQAHAAGLRAVMDDATIERVICVLRGERTQMPASWSHRLRHNHAKIKTGDALELAEVIRNLSICSRDRRLSLRDTRMLAEAKTILVSELTYARDMEEQDAGVFLDHLLEEIADHGSGHVAAMPVEERPLVD